VSTRPGEEWQKISSEAKQTQAHIPAWLPVLPCLPDEYALGRMVSGAETILRPILWFMFGPSQCFGFIPPLTLGCLYSVMFRQTERRCKVCRARKGLTNLTEDTLERKH
jgi:hypothetical protein